MLYYCFYISIRSLYYWCKKSGIFVVLEHLSRIMTICMPSFSLFNRSLQFCIPFNAAPTTVSKKDVCSIQQIVNFDTRHIFTRAHSADFASKVAWKYTRKKESYDLKCHSSISRTRFLKLLVKNSIITLFLLSTLIGSFKYGEKAKQICHTTFQHCF